MTEQVSHLPVLVRWWPHGPHPLRSLLSRGQWHS